MSTTHDEFSNVGFVKTFVLPALLIFLVPFLSLLFFLHAQYTVNEQVRKSIIRQVVADRDLSADQRDQAIELFSTVPFSRLVRDDRFAEIVSPELQTSFATFHWMIVLSTISLASGLAVFLVAGLCVLLSLRSAFAQYISLSVGWHVLRLHGVVQTVIQGILIVALSFWVTALWTERYFVKLVFLAGATAVVACVVVIRGIFKRIRPESAIEGEVLTADQAAPMWQALQQISARVGTEPPDQVVVGIDANFFVTEQPVVVGGQTYKGRTLYVSLPLLKQFRASEADAVLAHEMAHFSGEDTLYSRRISPLLFRYGHYLEALESGWATRPVFSYMLCFRALYEISLTRLSRQREFRADSIAAATTSSRDLAGALLRIVAYSTYRDSVESDLFQLEQVMESANISDRIAQGFPEFATSFASAEGIGALSTGHPFDTHPPLSQRFDAVGVASHAESAQALLTTPPDAAWYHRIHEAEQIERRQWADFEKRFRDYHEQSLPYRFLPETLEERSIVEAAFPSLQIDGKEGVLTIDMEKISYSKLWQGPIRYAEVTSMSLVEGLLQINFGEGGKQNRKLKIPTFGKRGQEVVDAINHYYCRYAAAQNYQSLKLERSRSESP
jgi:Zn-dependent protease with chaperone function